MMELRLSFGVLFLCRCFGSLKKSQGRLDLAKLCVNITLAGFFRAMCVKGPTLQEFLFYLYMAPPISNNPPSF